MRIANFRCLIADLALKKENLKLTLKSEIKILLPYKKANISC